MTAAATKVAAAASQPAARRPPPEGTGPEPAELGPPSSGSISRLRIDIAAAISAHSGSEY